MSAVLDEATVRRVAELARLRISDEEVARFAEQLSSILGYVEKLSELDTDDVVPTAHVHAMCNVLRSDEAHEARAVEQAMHNAPDSQADMFKVPKVLR